MATSGGIEVAIGAWARLIRKIFELNRLVCPCGTRMPIVSFITEPRVVDRILRHRESERCNGKDPFEPRPPPHVHARTLREPSGRLFRMPP